VESIAPAAARLATGIGIGSGLTAGLIDRSLAPRDFSFWGLLAFGLFGGITGLSFWLYDEGQRRERLRPFLMALAAGSFHLLLPLGFWHQVCLRRGPHWVGLFFGFICCGSMYLVATLWGVAYLFRSVVSTVRRVAARLRSLRSDRKLIAKSQRYPRSSLGGVWDPELDR
jgi:hypothetical protein